MEIKRRFQSVLFLGYIYIFCKCYFRGIDAIAGSYNIALRKPTNQGPRTLENYVSSLAVDGDLGQNAKAGECSHTLGSSTSTGSWWSVEFQGNYYISLIRILRRDDVTMVTRTFLRNRTAGCSIKGPPGNQEIYNEDQSGLLYNQPVINISVPISLRNIRFSGIQISILGDFLTLCEVQVFLARSCGAIVNNPPVSNGDWQSSAANIDEADGNCLHYLCAYTYNCQKGYIESAAKPITTTCNANGVWTNPEGTCKARPCDAIVHNPPISDGDWQSSATNIDDTDGNCLHYLCTYTYNCKKGYIQSVTQPITTTCNENGAWTTPEGTCKAIECSVQIQNETNYTVANLLEIYTYTMQLTAECLEGYELSSGNLSRTCLETGTWSGLEPICTIVSCMLPDEDATLETELRHSGSAPIYGSVVESVCIRGYKHVSGNLTRQCQADRAWSGTRPVCNVAQCSTPNTISNGKYFQISQNGTEETNQVELNNMYDFNATLNFKCDAGFVLLDQYSNYRVCLENETWSAVEPKCTELRNSSPEASSSDNAAMIGGSVGAAVAVIMALLLTAVIMYMRRKRQKPNADTSHQRSFRPQGDEQRVYININPSYQNKEYNSIDKVEKSLPDAGKIEEDQISFNQQENKQDVESKDKTDEYYNITPFTKKSPTVIMLEDLVDFVLAGKTATDKMETQFKALPAGMIHSHKAALKAENAKKNRYRQIYAYDDTRVVLTDCKDKVDTDYINASYINGFDTTKAYVASQGPTKDMINDFWRMIWQLDSGKIVMLTNLQEEYKMKCIQYWPDEGSCQFGSITVTIRDTDIYSDFVIRTLVIKRESNKEKVIHQFHFTAWPDRGVPKFSSAVVNFRNKVKNTKTRGKGPTIVHCSAGIGRTGTYISLDILTEQGKLLGCVDVASCVKDLRRQRVNMIQNLDQYVFLHTALTEALMLSSSAIPAAKFPEVYRELLQVDPVKRKRNIVATFDMLKHMSPVADEAQYRSAREVRNKKNNRYSNILPVSEFMPTLHGSSKAGYINAVYLPSYKDRKALILTQMPLENTKSDFWALVREHRVHTIVMMNTRSEAEQEDIYWPGVNESQTYNNVDVETMEVEDIGQHTVVTMNMIDGDSERMIKQIQCGYWPSSQSLPKSPSDIIRTIELVQSLQQHSGNHPIVVHCMNGVDRSGLFCVIAAVIERLKIEQDVAITQMIEQMRCCRDQIIPSVEQFQFCHEVILAYIQQFNEYSNFSAI